MATAMILPSPDTPIPTTFDCCLIRVGEWVCEAWEGGRVVTDNTKTKTVKKKKYIPSAE